MFSLLGLTLLTVGAVRFLDMGLKTYIFKMADEEQRLYSRNAYPAIPCSLEKFENISQDNRFSEEEVKAIKLWLAEYQTQKEKAENFDYVKAQRHREASMNLALIIVGLPLYLYHWGIIRQEVKKNQANQTMAANI